MKGQIFVVFEELVRERFGEEVLEALYVDAGIAEGALPFIGPATYPDEQLLGMVVALSARSGISVPDLVRAFGRYLFPRLAGRYPGFVQDSAGAKEFLGTVDRVIHVEVRKLEAGAQLPLVVLEEQGGTTRLRYRSPRKLCPLAEGLLEGVGDWYREEIRYQHVQCMGKGADACVWELEFAGRS